MECLASGAISSGSRVCSEVQNAMLPSRCFPSLRGGRLGQIEKFRPSAAKNGTHVGPRLCIQLAGTFSGAMPLPSRGWPQAKSSDAVKGQN